ncbi:hypothetical protein AGABI1DRAFT_131477 [Agaricus bisporus var. burnettii JB137-S8]|uniref:Uncharacterized protein n=1 Tax=Agaricus bisporus var. burnettii (strain JB137-S8 / ATCC MYA-4627 / FGSC 10392) TaxID=597362 RepID=K5WLJ4_AGABU|nr:uncharacterized protein AGABI1DRAFT_131477 [Agaricus bisporus var. burnettii JB137-S8]EKM76156.1 hypothetical protein AGABI1DRAFT_131477 [Agaricus bisporus var. burnettii JB137-S8]
MSNAPSPPSQDSCELPMDPDRYIEEAKEIFREAREDQANEQLGACSVVTAQAVLRLEYALAMNYSSLWA